MPQEATDPLTNVDSEAQVSDSGTDVGRETLSYALTDVIMFAENGEVLYRRHGTHPFVIGTDGVASVTPSKMTLPPPFKRVFLTNTCGDFLCPFYKQGREGLIIKNESFGNHSLIYHMDGVLQACLTVSSTAVMN